MPTEAKQNKQDPGTKPSPKYDGPAGVDKAPGEETAHATDDLIKLSQKGKKVDADPSLPSDQPVKE